MPLTGERLLIAATVDPVETGETFRRIPPHMTVIGWFSFSNPQKRFLFNAMGNLFDKKAVYQNAVGGKKVLFGAEHDIPVREMVGIETAPWFALHALVKSMGTFPEEDSFIDVFSPHVSDTADQVIQKRQQVAFPTVALFSKQPGDVTKHVDIAYSLASKGSSRG